MTELGPAAVERAVQHEPAADAGAEREHDHGRRSAPGPEAPLGERGRSSRRSRPPTGSPNRSLHPRPEVEVLQRDVHRAERPPGARSITDGIDEPERGHARRPAAPRPTPSSAASSSSCDSIGVRHSRRSTTSPSRVDDAGQDLRPAEVDADHALGRHGRAATITRPRWPTETSPTGSTAAGAQGQGPPASRGRTRTAGAPAAASRRPSAAPPARAHGGRCSCVLLVLVLVVVWLALGYLSVPQRRRRGERRGCRTDASSRPRAAGRAARLDSRRRSCCSAPTAPQDRGRGRRTPLRLDPARAHRPRPAPARLPLDPARPPRRHPGPRRRTRSTQRSSSAGPRSRCKTVRGVTGLPLEPRRRRRLRRLPRR